MADLTSTEKAGIVESAVKGATEITRSIIDAVSAKNRQEREYSNMLSLVQSQPAAGSVDWLTLALVGVPAILIVGILLRPKKSK